jgi:hypothetical protein
MTVLKGLGFGDGDDVRGHDDMLGFFAVHEEDEFAILGPRDGFSGNGGGLTVRGRDGVFFFSGISHVGFLCWLSSSEIFQFPRPKLDFPRSQTPFGNALVGATPLPGSTPPGLVSQLEATQGKRCAPALGFSVAALSGLPDRVVRTTCCPDSRSEREVAGISPDKVFICPPVLSETLFHLDF